MKSDKRASEWIVHVRSVRFVCTIELLCLSSSTPVDSLRIQEIRSAPVSSGLCFKAHSQTTATRHPIERSFRIATRSRWRFRVSFASQKSALVAGIRNSGQLSWWCQKHPWTNTTTPHRCRTISGRPGRPLPCSLKRRPERHSSFRI